MDYEQIKKVCEEKGCYCPPSHEAAKAIANTPAWLRYYFAEGSKQ